MILREMLRHEALARTLLYSDKYAPSAHQRLSIGAAGSPGFLRFYNFVDYIEQTTFGIACDAQANFKARGSSLPHLITLLIPHNGTLNRRRH